MDSYEMFNTALVVSIAWVVLNCIKRWWCRKEVDIAARYLILAEHEVAAADKGMDLDLTLDDVSEIVVPNLADSSKKARRVKHGLFKSYLAQEGKAKFGTPMRTTANLLVVRKYLYDLSVEAGVLPRHIIRNVDIATELVFIPSHDELTALAIRHTVTSQERHEVRDRLGQKPDLFA